MGVIPPGGFKFFQRLPNGSFHQFLGTNEADLVKQITQFRANNGMELGEPEKEVISQISGATHKVMGDQRSLRERVTAWKANRQFGKIELVDQETAYERARQAALCSHNVLDYADDCIECYSHTMHDLFAMRQGRSTPYDDQLGADSICGHDTKTAVWLDEKHLLHVRNYVDELRKRCPNCWLLKLDKPTVTEVA